MNAQKIILETLQRLNASLTSDANAIMGVTRDKETPEAAYVRLVAQLLASPSL